jgi:hypothetical protein
MGGGPARRYALVSNAAALRRPLARASCAALAASLVAATAGGGSASAYNRYPKNCDIKGRPDVGAINATIHIHSKTPKVGNDPIRVKATAKGKPLSGGKVHYLFLYQGQIVSCQPVGPPAKPYFIHGVFRDTLQFPPDAVLAQPYLIVRVVIEWHGWRRNIDVAVSVHK